MKKVVEKALRTPENASDDVVENIAMDMLRYLCSSRKVRKIFICFTKSKSNGIFVISLFRIQESKIFLPLINAQYYGTLDQSRKLLKLAAVLKGLNVIEEFEDGSGSWKYIGPDVYGDFSSSLFENHRTEHNLKELNVALSVIEIPESSKYEIAPPTFDDLLSTINQNLPVANNAEKIRSIQNKNIVCKCGYMTEAKAHKGYHRRMRCKDCEGCKAPKCGRCKHCLYPHLKKPCENRVCRFPKIPKCPCFT